MAILFKYLVRLVSISLCFIVFSCANEKDKPFVDQTDKRFTLLPEQRTGISFQNDLEYTEELNAYTYRNFYNGAGVGIGDINNDGLPDVYFCGNQVDNKLYLNQGDFKFTDITASAGVTCPDIWSTGVAMVDVNGDGWLDIYVCKSGPPGGNRRHNELFINNRDLTFSEQSAAYGLDEVGLSIHAAFFDYDLDGDLDCYLLNNSIRSTAGYDLIKDLRNRRDPEGGNKLLRNEGNRFVDVSEEAGIYGSPIGFGLGVTVGDVNDDGWPDLFVSNDFFERDYLYLNQQDGTFAEELEAHLPEISMGSMGADMADLTNDGLPEIFVTEMLPQDEKRLKTKADFQSWDRYQLYLRQGYYHQFSRNVLHLNRGGGMFSEVSRYAGVHATDWSWGALIFDMDNDGWKDIFVANGVYKDLLDRDYINFYSDPAAVRKVLQDGEGIQELLDQIPTEKLANGVFRNSRNLQFQQVAQEWGLDQASHSNGSAYADLDNDGDLDLLVNNINMPAFVYRNNTTGENYLSVSLQGQGKNPFAIGAKVSLFHADQVFYQELNPMRGFQSCTDYRLHFGVGQITQIDSLLIQWPDGSHSIHHQLDVNQLLSISQAEETLAQNNSRGVLQPTVFQTGVAAGFEPHRENLFIDFDRDQLLFQSFSTEGPALAGGDVNQDGLTDVYLCGAKDQKGQLLLQNRDGSFRPTANDIFAADSLSEDTDALFFDADGDGDLDLYVCSGGYEFSANSMALMDRLYINAGNGQWQKSNALLPSKSRPVSSACVRAADYDGDGDLDLFVGGRLRPFLYGVAVDSYLLQNDGKGNFTQDKRQKALADLGMVTDAVWADLTGDGVAELVIVGDWMNIRVLRNQNGQLVDDSASFGLENTSGWWHTVLVEDVDGDGDLDIIAGNHGLNSRIKADADHPVRMYINDFDQNGKPEHILTAYNGAESYPVVQKDDLLMQLPSLKKRYLKYTDFAGQRMEDIFAADLLQKSVVLEAHHLATTLFRNQGNGRFATEILPAETQFAPVYAIACADFTGDQRKDILVGGNLQRVKPELGIYNSSYGLLLAQTKQGEFRALNPLESGLQIRGEIRDFLLTRNRAGEERLLVARNNDQVLELLWRR